jgi:hypothetical protein
VQENEEEMGGKVRLSKLKNIYLWCVNKNLKLGKTESGLFEIKLQDGVRYNHKFGRFLEARKAMNLNMMSKEQGVEHKCLLFLHQKPTASNMLSFKAFLSICERKVHFEPSNSYKKIWGMLFLKLGFMVCGSS